MAPSLVWLMLNIKDPRRTPNLLDNYNLGKYNIELNYWQLIIKNVLTNFHYIL